MAFVFYFLALLLAMGGAFWLAWRGGHPAAASHAGLAGLAMALAVVVGLPFVWLSESPAGEHGVLAALAALAALAFVWRSLRRRRVRYGFEQLLTVVFGLAALVAVFATAGIIASVFYEAAQFFREISLFDFLFGLKWSPQIAIREGQVGASGEFGLVPLIAGTFLISAIAMLFATPIGFLTAAYMSEFATKRARNRIKPLLEILAGVPTIVYGFFALTVLSPWLVDLGEALQVEVAGENALAAGLVMGVLLIPLIASLTEDGFHAVPDTLRQGALGLGATRYEMTMQVVVPAALPSFVAGLLLAFSRAVGETMIVVMAAGISANLSLNPLQAITTITVQIVTLLTGDQAFDDVKTLSAFALGLVLFVVTLLFNLVALRIVRKYQQRYD